MIDAAAARRFAMYVAVGGIGTVAHYALLLALVGSGLAAPAMASVCGALLGAVINFVLNASVTFGAAVSKQAARRFVVTAAAGMLVNGLMMKVLVDGAGIDFRLAQVLATLAVLLLTFCINSVWTFRPLDTGGCAPPDARERLR